MAEDFIYDAIPYPSFSFPQTRPDRLSTIGLFYGIETATPDKCRVLELGCGNGTNLISFAYTHPESSFLGIDLSSVHIVKADDTKQRLGLKNIKFQCLDILAIDPNELGKFDFIIAHGLFSWVPEEVRERILTIYSECLAQNGIGYISYNAYPGFHIREIVRRIMRYHTRTIESPLEKVEKGVEIIRLLSNARQDEIRILSDTDHGGEDYVNEVRRYDALI
ncbi:class I SAM-dependent methyltransferase [Leptolyngbya sp. 7M]|uniref:class I SAM-dependent methyltransferase n=1 Tax=Leptolyngbya sp. 7M TaxID=2812896 RepID=UPI001B8C00A0|nr:class I SAM-dependent methyltransferase [Leptolyngbya sp. 7M]QYO67142.1 class I SAM-dependent methyltransferase [Leptolyngbya sp. 7M]